MFSKYLTMFRSKRKTKEVMIKQHLSDHAQISEGDILHVNVVITVCDKQACCSIIVMKQNTKYRSIKYFLYKSVCQK